MNAALAEILAKQDEAAGYIEALQLYVDSTKRNGNTNSNSATDNHPEWFRPYVIALLNGAIQAFEREAVKREAAVERRNRGNMSAANMGDSGWEATYGRLKACTQILESNEDIFTDLDLFLGEVRGGNYYMVELLLKDFRVETSHRDFDFEETAIGIAIMGGDGRMAQLLMSDERSQHDLAFHQDEAIRMVLATGDPGVLRLLLSFPQITQIDPEILGPSNLSLVKRVRSASLDVIDGRLPQAVDTFGAFRLQNAEIVRILLADPRLNPVVDDVNYINWSILHHILSNNYKIVRVLLEDPRSTPADIFIQGNMFLCAVYLGHLEVLRVLLQDPRISPVLPASEHSKNPLLLLAVRRGNVNIVEELIRDGRAIKKGVREALNAAVAKQKELPGDFRYPRIIELLKPHCSSSSCSVMGGGRKTRHTKKAKKARQTKKTRKTRQKHNEKKKLYKK